MVGRLRAIADGKLPATAQDMNFYTHELREFVRYRRLGHRAGGEGNYELWNDTHTATLEDYGLTEPPYAQRDGHPLYHPDAFNVD